MSDDKERILLGLKYAAVLESITDDSLSSLASALDGDLKMPLPKSPGSLQRHTPRLLLLVGQFAMVFHGDEQVTMPALFWENHALSTASKN